MLSLPYESVGTLIYTPAESKLHLQVDEGIVDLARALLPKRVTLNRTRFAPHITLVRNEAVPVDMSGFDGQQIAFTYDPRVVAGEVYWWLRAWSDDLVAVRRFLGLPALSELCRPPDGEDVFHITIGNTKGIKKILP